MDLQGQVVIITGAGRGLGRQHALHLARCGASVVVNDIGTAIDGTGTDRRPADAVVAEIAAGGGTAVPDHNDVTTEEGTAAIVEHARERFGALHAVVNNAGILRDRSFHKMSWEEWHAVVDVHLFGAFRLTRAAWPYLREQAFGRVVMTTSTTGIRGNFGQVNYGAAKLGLVGMVNTLALEGERYDIKVNAIDPIAATRMSEDVLTASTKEQMRAEFVSPAVAYLVSPGCGVSGEILSVRAGRYSRIAYMNSPGVEFDGVPTPDELAAQLDRIMDMDGARLEKEQ